MWLSNTSESHETFVSLKLGLYHSLFYDNDTPLYVHRSVRKRRLRTYVTTTGSISDKRENNIGESKETTNRFHLCNQDFHSKYTKVLLIPLEFLWSSLSEVVDYIKVGYELAYTYMI